MADLIGLCMKCKQKRKMNEVKIEKNKKGRFAARGVCSVCGTKMYKILSKEEAQKRGGEDNIDLPQPDDDGSSSVMGAEVVGSAQKRRAPRKSKSHSRKSKTGGKAKSKSHKSKSKSRGRKRH